MENNKKIKLELNCCEDFYCDFTREIDQSLKKQYYETGKSIFKNGIHYVYSGKVRPVNNGIVTSAIRKPGYTLGSFDYEENTLKIISFHLNSIDSFITGHYRVDLKNLEKQLHEKYVGCVLEF